MALGKRAIGAKRGGIKAPQPAVEPAAAEPTRTGLAGLPLPGLVAGTNLLIADIVLRAAGGLLRERMEQGPLIKSYAAAKAERLAGARSLAASAALWGASRLARRSPLGLAVVVGGLAAKLFYDHGKRLEVGRAEREAACKAPTDQS